MHYQQAQANNHQDLPIFIKWMEFLKWLFITTEKFPKSVRFTLTQRINSLALDIVESLVEARYTASKQQMLKEANVSLEKIRVLLRICYESKILPHTAYEYSAQSINEIGQMLGGWQRQQDRLENAKAKCIV